MPTVTVVLDGGGQLTVTTLDKTPLKELASALAGKKEGQEFKVSYSDAVIVVPDGAKVLGGAVSGLVN